MDPDACIDRILSALNRKDAEEAEDAAEDLLGWLGRGGFRPRRPRTEALAEAMDALADTGADLLNVGAVIDVLRGEMDPDGNIGPTLDT